MILLEGLYEGLVRVGSRLLPLLPLGSPKLRAGLRGRREVLDRLRAWGASGRETDRPLLWFHAPSVGEGLQIRPVIEVVRERRPALQVFYSFFSPSAEEMAREFPVDFADYLPVDTTASVTAALDALEPVVIVFGKTEVWPILTRVAKDREVRLALVSATVAPSSSRLRPVARALLRHAYRRLDVVGAITREDADRLVRLGVDPNRIEVTGDARFDQALDRAARIDPDRPPLSWVRVDAPTLIAGSTWPEDERRLVPALGNLRGRHPELRVIVAPHEPTSGHVSGLERRLRSAGFATATLAQLERGSVMAWQALIVDRVGVLADLYAVADIAYVGGGFGRRGLHSVLEPAAVGVPITFGPRHANAREAGELIERGAARVSGDAERLEKTFDLWLREPARREQAGATARGYVEAHRGADRRNAELVLDLVAGSAG